MAILMKIVGFILAVITPFASMIVWDPTVYFDKEIAAAEDEIKAVMGSEETLLAGAFKVDWKTVITSRIDTTALKKMMPEIAERFMKQTTSRRFCVR